MPRPRSQSRRLDSGARRSSARRRHGRRRTAAFSTSAAATARCCACSARKKGVDARGIELSQRGVNDCVAKGLSVIQGDADTDLAAYPDDAFDYVILSQTLQATRQPRKVLEHMLRIGRHAIVSFPNFGHWRIRVAGRVRRPHAADAQSCPRSWYETPNIHFCTISDFCRPGEAIDARIERGVALDRFGTPLASSAPWIWNLFGEQGVFRLTRKREGIVPERGVLLLVASKAAAIAHARWRCQALLWSASIWIDFDDRARLLRVAPAIDLDPFVRFEILVVGERNARSAAA